MKFNVPLLILVLLLSPVSNVCFASNNSQVLPFTAFYLDSALGNRALVQQAGAILESPQALPLRKSPNGAFFYSFVVPGMGQLYTGAKRGYLYTAAEIGFLTGYFILRNSAADTRDEYREVVKKHVIFEGPGSFENWDPIEDFEHATQYENWNHVYDSEATRARTGKWYWSDAAAFKDIPDTNIEFDSRHRLEAFELRQTANDTFQRARTLLGLAILNHVVSAIDARITTKRWNHRQKKHQTIKIDVQTDGDGALTGTLALRKRF